MSFLRHKEIYPAMGSRSDPATAPRLHRWDEFPAGYSSTSCSPAELASASPASGSIDACISVGNGLPANSYLSLVSLYHLKGAVQRFIGLFGMKN